MMPDLDAPVTELRIQRAATKFKAVWFLLLLSVLVVLTAVTNPHGAYLWLAAGMISILSAAFVVELYWVDVLTKRIDTMILMEAVREEAGDRNA